MTPDDLLAVARGVVTQANANEEIEVACSYGQSRSIRVYEGEVESLTTADNSGIGVRVLIDGREGFASAGSLAPDVVADMLSEARDNAAFAEGDPYVGLARPDGVEPVEIELWRPGVSQTSNQDKIDLAIDLERRVRGHDARVTGVRVASYGDNEGSFALVSTSGMEAATKATSASISVQALALDGDRTQTGFAYDGGRDPADLRVDYVVDRAVSQAVDLIGATKPVTATVDLVLDQHMAATIVGLVAGTLTGDRVIKGRSPFVDRVGEQVAAQNLTFVDDATNPASLGADSHDGEGLACRPVPLVVDGILQGFLHDSYTGRRSGAGSTGSAVRGTRGLPAPGVHALSVTPGQGSLDELIGQCRLGLMVFSLAGLHSGVNPVSGDFSVGVEGRMIRHGELAEPVSECTIGSTLQRLLLDVTTIGGDLEHLPSGVSTPSLIVGGVALSGSS
ncbi:MAG: TldD/PmbA family protein [Actinomycetia bacterium]|nr:TldD/PmbA family protein [Actinomycetes bacterium]